MEWGAVAALASSFAVVGAFFLWIVQAIVKNSVTEAVNGFKVRVAVLEDQHKAIAKSCETNFTYAHDSRHDLVGFITQLQLDMARLHKRD